MTISELPDRVFINDPKKYSDGETTPGTWTIKPDWCFKHEYRRADLSPTLSAALELPEVKALVEARRTHIDAVDAYNAKLILVNKARENGFYGHGVDAEFQSMGAAQRAFYGAAQDFCDAALAAIKEPKI